MAATTGSANIAAEKEFRQRLDEARQFKRDIRADLMEGYFFTAPRRARDISTEQQNVRSKSAAADDQAELQTTLGTECADDFASMIVDAFMPSNFDWCKRGQGMLTDQQWSLVKRQIETDDMAIMAAIRASNLEAVITQAFNPDLALGTCGIWIEEGMAGGPPNCRAIPVKNLDINCNSDGVTDRFVTKYVKGRDIAAELPGIEMPAAQARKIENKPADAIEVVWGLWRDYSAAREERWEYTIHVDRKQVWKSDPLLLGEGSCPLIVPRFNIDPTNPWGDGPVLQALPYLRVIDALAGVTQDNAEFQVDPAFVYPNDGIINFQGGIQHGMAYPAQPGFSGKDLGWLRPDSNPNAGFFTIEDLRRSVKRLFYSDFPEQMGKTPPTATQWVDEMVKMQKRLGLKGLSFWREGPRAIFQRFRYLLEAAGRIKPIMVGGQAVSLEPYNPAVKGQEFQEVQTAQRLLEMILSLLGVQGQALVNAPATAENLQEKLGDKIVAFNNPEQFKATLASLIPQADLNIGNTAAG